MGDTPQKESPGILHRVGIATDGVYQGLIKMGTGAGIAVDVINKGLNVIGVPTAEKPVGGSAWIKEKLTGAYEGYNKVAGVNVPKPVDRADVIIHAVGDLVGQTAIPIAAAASKPAAAVAGLKEVAGAVKNSVSYTSAANSTATDAAAYAANTSRAAVVAAGTAAAAANATKPIEPRADFKAAAAPAAATPAPAVAVTAPKQDTVAVATPAAATSTAATASATTPAVSGGSMADKYAALIGQNLTSATVPVAQTVAAAPAAASPAPAVKQQAGMTV